MIYEYESTCAGRRPAVNMMTVSGQQRPPAARLLTAAVHCFTLSVVNTSQRHTETGSEENIQNKTTSSFTLHYDLTLHHLSLLAAVSKYNHDI